MSVTDDVSVLYHLHVSALYMSVDDVSVLYRLHCLLMM